MTISLDGTQIGEIIEIAAIVGSIVATAIVAGIVYLIVRPPRHVREQRRIDARMPDPIEEEEMLRLIDALDARIGTLERLVEHDERRELTPVEDGRENRRN